MTILRRTKGVAGSAVAAALATVVFIAVWVQLPGDRDVSSLMYILALGVLAARAIVRGVVAVTATATTRERGPRPFDLAFRPGKPRTVDTLNEPRQIVFELRSSQDLASTLHFRLRPRLRAIADDRLVANHGLALDRDPEASRRLLGDEAWELLSADRRQPIRRSQGAISGAELERIVSAVERL
jgi:hypothetical protein